MKQQRFYMYYRPWPMLLLNLFCLGGGLIWIYLSFYHVFILHNWVVISGLVFGAVAVTGVAYSFVCYLCFFASELVFDSDGVHRILYKKERQFIPWDRVSVIYMRQDHVIAAHDLIVFAKERLDMPTRQIFKGRQCLWLKRHPEVYFWMTYAKTKEACLREYAADKIQECP